MKNTVLQHLFHHNAVCKTPVILLALLGITGNVWAQTDTARALNEVNVSAALAPNLQSISPSQAITNADFIRYSAFNVADAIRNFAGVNVRDYGGIGGLKTVSVRSLGANHTIVLYDGVQINDAQNGQMDLSKFNLYNIDEIALHIPQPDDICMPARAFAAASVLSIKTIRPKLTPEKPFEITAGIKGGSFGLFNPYLQWQQRLGNKWSFIVNTYKQEANGKYHFKSTNFGKDTSGTRLNGDVHARQIDGALYWKPSNKEEAYIRFNYYDIDRGLPGAVIDDAQYLDQRLQNRDMFAQAGYSKTWASGTRVLLHTKLSKNYQHYTDVAFLNNKNGLDDEYTQREIYQSAAISFNVFPSVELSYAADVSVTDLNSDAFAYAFPTRLWLLNNLAAKYTLGKLTLQGNLLHTYINDGVKVGQAPPSKSAFNPTFMVNIQASKALLFRAFYKNIFRYPTLSDQYYYTPQPRLVNPEYARQYNAGAVYTRYFHGLLKYAVLSADAYYNTIKDKIIYLPGRSAEIPSVRNLGKVDIRGLDVKLKTLFKPAYTWDYTLSAAYTFQKALNVTNTNDAFYLQQIPYTPVHSINLNAGVVHKHFGVNYNFSSSSSRYQYSNNTPDYYLAPYAISDVSAKYNFIYLGKELTATAEINNLFGKHYEVVRYYPMPPRSIRLSLQIIF